MSQIDTSTTGGKIALPIYVQLGDDLALQQFVQKRAFAAGKFYSGGPKSTAYTDTPILGFDGRSLDRSSEETLRDHCGYRLVSIPEFIEALTYKPLKFPEPPEGKSWHRAEGFTPEKFGIGDGYRPMVLDEQISVGDQYFADEVWQESALIGSHIQSHYYPYRTRRDLPTPKKRVPLEAKDIPALCWIRREPALVEPLLVTHFWNGEPCGHDFGCSYQEMMEQGWEYSPDRVTWLPCDKEAE